MIFVGFIFQAVILPLALSAGLCALFIKLLFPLLQRYALARPNERSSHSVPTPQGAGIAVIVALCATSALFQVLWFKEYSSELNIVISACAILAITGLIDDLKPLAAIPRLFIQTIAVTAVVIWGTPLTADNRILPALISVEIEMILLILAGVWSVNLTNFMDGLDHMSVVELVPVGLGCALLLAFADQGTSYLLALSLAGAMLGFAPFNRHPARVFLGDVGSLPLGLIMFYLLLTLALKGQWLAALILPLYYLIDATITLLRRMIKGERIWQAHRTHFYQQATDNGFTPQQVTRTILTLNTMLVVFAFASSLKHPRAGFGLVDMLYAILAITCVSAVLWRFSRPHQS